MTIDTLNKVFVSKLVLSANEMNLLSQKIDEIINRLNNISDTDNFITTEQADAKYATLQLIGDIESILDNIIGG